jgi:predicted DNA-binding transcriptional regulator AlpA
MLISLRLEANRSPTQKQNMEIIMHSSPSSPDALITLSTLVEMLQRSRASLYRDIKRGEFPKQIKLGNSSRWIRSEVEDYLAKLTASRDDN